MSYKNRQHRRNSDTFSIDFSSIFKMLWKRAWAIVLCALLGAGIGFSIARFFTTPMYKSSIMLYVNNSSISVGNTSFSITSSEISAAQCLAKTYAIILDNRTTLEQVIEKADVDITYHELTKMIKSESVNDTEVLKISVTSDDPYMSEKLVNCIALVLPERIAEVIHGSSMEVFDSGIANLNKVSPSYTDYTVRGFLIGAFISVVFLIVLSLMDTTIHDEDYITKNYDYPILVSIPDLSEKNKNKKYGYYHYYRSNSQDESKQDKENKKEGK